MERPLALVVDRDPSARDLIRKAFEGLDADVRGAGDGAEALRALRALPVEILILDGGTPGVEVAALLREVSKLQRPPVVLARAAHDDAARDEAWIAHGAFDVVAGALDEDRIRLAAGRAVRHARLLAEVRRLRVASGNGEADGGLLGRSRAVERLRESVRRLAGTRSAVWLWGEPGTGKETAARRIHAASRLAEGRFEVVACADLEARGWNGGELGPPGAPAGSWRHATLYLADVAALSVERQSRLLGSLETLAGAGGDVRTIASSREAPAALVERGRLLETLAERLAGEVVAFPPLRERSGDIPLLARHFVGTICEINRLPPIQLEPEALELLEGHVWPGNVRELHDALERAVILSSDGKIRPRDLPGGLQTRPPRVPQAAARPISAAEPFREAKREVVEAFERAYLRALMERYAGNVTAAARQAGMLRSALQRLLRKYGFKSAEFRRARRASAEAEGGARPDR